MNTFKKFKVNAKESLMNTASHSLTGLMSKEDKILLDSLVEANKSENVNNITINAPEISLINQEFESYNSQIETNSKKIERLNSLIESQGYCGRVWDESSASPTAKTYCGNLDMLRNLPNILGLGGYLVQNDHTRRKLSKENHYFFEDGTEAKLDGTMGHYQWGWNKPFYITTWEDNNLHYECISLEPIKGRESYYVPVGSMSAAGHAAIDRETNTLVSYINDSPRYRGGNNNANWDEDEEKSLLGECATFKSTAEFAEAAHKNGTGWYAGTMRMYSVMTILFHIIMGTRNSHAEFNPIKNSDGLYECGLDFGVNRVFNNTKLWEKYNNINPFLSLSECIELGDYIGVSETKYITYKNENNEDTTQRYTIPILFGLKNPFSYIWRVNEDEFAEGDSTHLVHYIRKSMYDGNYIYGKKNESIITGSKFLYNGNNYIKDFSYKNLELWPIDINEEVSYNTFYCDSVYSNGASISLRAVFRGGRNLFGLCSGITTIAVDCAISYVMNHVGSPLCEFTEDFLLDPIKR